MAFLPYNCSAYQVFIKSEMPNLTSGLDSLGYQTAAIHPYLSTSWNRTNVYRFFGFEAQYYQDDFAADASRVRDYISDSASYKKIFELYENKRENKMCIRDRHTAVFLQSRTSVPPAPPASLLKKLPV